MKIKWYAKIHIDMRERERERKREREAGKSIYMHVCYISYTYVICTSSYMWVERVKHKIRKKNK